MLTLEEASRFCLACQFRIRKGCPQCQAILKACAVEREQAIRILARELGSGHREGVSQATIFAVAGLIRGGKRIDCDRCGTLLDPDHQCREIFPVENV